MSTSALIADIMFAVYLSNFIGGFLNSFFKNPTGRVWADIIFGVILLLLVLNLN